MEYNNVMNKEIIKLEDVQKMGVLVVDDFYYIYKRNHKSFGYKKYMSLFSPEEKGFNDFLFKVKNLGDNKFIRIDD